MCPRNVDLWPIYTKIRSCDQNLMIKICAYLEVNIPMGSWNIRSYNSDFVAPLLNNRCCHGNHFVPHYLGVVLMSASTYELDIPPGTELLQFLSGYVTGRCDLDLWCFDLGVIALDATWVVNPSTKFEVDMTYRSRVRTTTISTDRQPKVPIFTFLGIRGSNFKFHLSDPQKALR